MERSLLSIYAIPKSGATLDQFRWFDALCDLSQFVNLDGDAIPNTATRDEAQALIDQRENWLAQICPDALAELHSTFDWHLSDAT
jgi:hypothetical protein